jgi:hypothetical protein
MIHRFQDVTPAVLAVMGQTTDPRAREIMQSLMTHMYCFLVDTKFTDVEFRQATAIINEIGQPSIDEQSYEQHLMPSMARRDTPRFHAQHLAIRAVLSPAHFDKLRMISREARRA